MRHLGDRGDRGVPPAAGQPLLDRHRGRQTEQQVDVGLRHDVQELARVGRQAVDVPALPLGVEDVEGERGLARAGKPGHHDQAVARQLEAHVLQVVLAGADDTDAAVSAARRRRVVHLGGERGPRPPAVAEDLGQVAAGVRAGRARDRLRRPGGDQAAAGVAALGSEVDHPVGALHHLEVVLDHDERVAALDEPREAAEQPLDVGEVQPGGRLVEDEERVRLALPPEMRGELHALGLAARERRQRLAEPQVVEPDVDQGAEAPGDVGDVGEDLDGLGDGEVEDLADVAPVRAHLQHLGPEARSAALRAGDVDVGEELHLDLLEALAGARLAAPAGDVEGERRRRVAAQARRLGRREAGPDQVEGAQVGDRIRPRRRADGRLVDEHDVGDALGAADLAARTRDADRLPAALLEAAVEDLLDQRRLAGARNAGHRDEAAERDVDIEVLEVVGRRAAHAEAEMRERPPPLAGHGNLAPPAEEGARDRGARAGQLGGRAREDEVASALARAGAEVDRVIGGADDRGVVLDDDHGVPLVAQPVQGTDETLRIARVQPDRGLVEDVERVHQRRADGGGQVDALELPARERARLPVERQVLEPRLHEVAKAAADLGEDQAGDGLGLRRRQPEVAEEHRRLSDRHAVHLRDRPAADAEVERLGLDARARARGAEAVAPEAREEDAHVHAIRPTLEPAEPAAHARIVAAAIAFEHELPLGRIELPPRHVGRDAATAAELGELAALPGGGLRRPRFEGAGGERAAGVGDDEVEVQVDHAPEAAASLARAERAVEGEQVGHGVAHRETARGALERGREADGLPTVGQHGRRPPAPVREGLLERLDQPPALRRPQPQPVLHHGQRAVDERWRLELLEPHDAVRAERPHEARLEEARADVGPWERGGRREREGDERSGTVVRADEGFGGALGGVPLDHPAAAAAMGNADLGEQELQVVVQLGHRAHRRARRLDRAALIDRDRGQDAVDAVDTRLVHAIEELAGIGGEALDVAPLPFGVEHVEGEARLPRSRHARDDGQRPERHADVDAPQVVFAGAEDLDGGRAHRGRRGAGRGRFGAPPNRRVYAPVTPGKDRSPASPVSSHAHAGGATTSVSPEGARRPGAFGAAP